MSLTVQEEQELERLLLMLDHWEKIAKPPAPALQAPQPGAETRKPTFDPSTNPPGFELERIYRA